MSKNASDVVEHLRANESIEADTRLLDRDYITRYNSLRIDVGHVELIEGENDLLEVL